MHRCFIIFLGMVGLTGADDPTTEALLESKGIVRRPGGFVLQFEEVVKTRLKTLRFRAEEFSAAYTRLSELQWAIDRIDALDHEVIAVNATIANLNFQMGQFPGSFVGGRTIHGTNLQDEAAYQAIRADRDRLVVYRDSKVQPEREILRKQQPGFRMKDALEAEKLRRASMLAGLTDVREVVVATNKGYEELSKDAKVQQALRKLGQTKFGPTAEFLANAQSLTQFEKLLGQKPTVMKATSKAARKKPRG
jgi:hypothetical protein